MSTPFDIPIIPPSGGGGGGSLPYATVQNEVTETIINPAQAGKVISNFTLTITPTSETQKVCLSGVVNGGWTPSSERGAYILIKRGDTTLGPPDAGSRTSVNACFMSQFENKDFTFESAPFTYIDDPETTSELSYTVFVINGQDPNADFYLNRTVQDLNSSGVMRMSSTFTAQCFEP